MVRNGKATTYILPAYCFLSRLDVESARLRMEETMRENANRPLFSGSAVSNADHWVAAPDASADGLFRKMLQKFCLMSTPLPPWRRATSSRNWGPDMFSLSVQPVIIMRQVVCVPNILLLTI